MGRVLSSIHNLLVSMKCRRNNACNMYLHNAATSTTVQFQSI